MTAIRKMERDFLQADLTAVETMIEQVTDDDFLTLLSLKARRDELQQSLSGLATESSPLAQAALFFGGRPVIASRGIETEFSGLALSKFQDLVSKVMAHKSGGLGQRGIVANKAASTLHVTNIVRGSFGFLLEEVEPPQTELVDTSLKDAVNEVTHLLGSFGDENEEAFQAALDTVDERIVSTAKEFFDHIKGSSATLRIVADDSDKSFGTEAISRAAERAVTTIIKESEETAVGVLEGTLPNAHQFEFLIADDEHGIVKGRVDRSLSEQTLMQWNRDLVGKRSIAHFTVKRVYRDGFIVRENYVLKNLT